MKKTTYDDDLQDLHDEFWSEVDPHDIDSIHRWFAKYPYFSTSDHARVANRSLEWIRILKRRANIKGRMPTTLPTPNPSRRTYNIDVPEDWDTPEWLGKAVKTHSIKALADAIGVSRRTIGRRLKAYNIEPPDVIESTRPKHPCCTREWCYTHYVEKGLSQRQCAKLAGICFQTFANWLNRFKIPIRTAVEANSNHRDVRLWVRELIYNLEQQEVVRKVYIRDDHIHVRFMNFFWETYYIEKHHDRPRRLPLSYSITKQHARLEKVPTAILEYETELDGESYPAHIMIKKADWQVASFMEQRLALHYLAWTICRRGWIWPKYPSHVLEHDLSRLRNSKQTTFIQNGKFTAIPNYSTLGSAGFRIIQHFFGLEELWEVFRSPRLTMRVLNELVKTNVKINTHNIIRVACYNPPFPKYRKVKLADPCVYYWIFKRLGITGTVLDLHPNHGLRAIACALAGLRYTTIPSPEFQKAIDNGFAEYIGLDYVPYDGGKVDLVLNDDNFKPVELEPALEYASKAHNLMHFVRRGNKRATLAKFEPNKIIEIRTGLHRRSPDYLFLF